MVVMDMGGHGYLVGARNSVRLAISNCVSADGGEYMTFHRCNDSGGTRGAARREAMRRFASRLACSLSALVIAACGGGTSSRPLPAAVALTAPANLANGLSGTVNLAASVPADAAVSAVEFQIDGSAVGSVATPPYQISLDAATYPAGQHVVRARARDGAGNVSGWSSATISIDGGSDVMPGFTKNEPWVGGLNGATAFAQAADGRLFIAEQGGRLRVVKNGALLSTAFVQLSVDSAGERGLIGVALHPDFAGNGWVYLHYTTPQNGAHNRISRFVANGDVSSGIETVLVELPPLSSATNHNGGALHFGNDGKLYVGVGDNADNTRSQNLADPLGKMLRFNDDGSIPSDNPFFASQNGVARAIWASGLRNPFTFAVQPGTGGRIYINDVGEATWEEIDVGIAGANYGWHGSEGPDNITSGVSAPLFAYQHSATVPPGSGPGGFFTGSAITGGTFYPRSGSFPAGYRGSYFFADLAGHFVARLDSANDNAASTFARVSDDPVDLLVGADGALYVLMRGSVARIGTP